MDVKSMGRPVQARKRETPGGGAPLRPPARRSGMTAAGRGPVPARRRAPPPPRRRPGAGGGRPRFWASGSASGSAAVSRGRGGGRILHLTSRRTRPQQSPFSTFWSKKIASGTPTMQKGQNGTTRCKETESIFEAISNARGKILLRQIGNTN